MTPASFFIQRLLVSFNFNVALVSRRGVGFYVEIIFDDGFEWKFQVFASDFADYDFYKI